MEVEGFDGPLDSVFVPDPPSHRGGPGPHIAVGCESSYGPGQLLDPERAGRDGLGADTQFGDPPPPERLVREERHHEGGDAGVVPAPPWCMAALTPSKSQSCGTSSTLKTVSGRSALPIPPQPVASNPLWPSSSSACSTILVSLSAAMLFMLPNPMNTGGDPASRKSVNSRGACHPRGRSRNQ